MKTIGIKLADGSFYPVLEEGSSKQKVLDLTTAHNNQTKVMVDLYRSSTCSMEDAEYVDSLQIENLNAHPTGQADISFSVALDENNNLTANIADPETGKESNTSITLVSRTLEERLITDEYQISENSSKNTAKKAAAGIAAGGGLLAMASAIRKKEEEKKSEQIIESEPVFEETAIEESETVSEDDFTLGDPEANTTETDIFADLDTSDKFFEENSDILEDNTSEDYSSFNFAETDISENTETTEENQPSAENDIFAETTEDSTDLPVFNFDDTTVTENNGEMEESFTEEIPEFDYAANESENSGTAGDALGFAALNTNETTVNTAAEDDIFADTTVSDSELPDFNFDEDSTVAAEAAITSNSEDLYEFEDSSLNESDIQTEDPFADDDLFATDSFAESNGFTSTANEEIPSGKAISFTGLYDKETELGKSSDYEEEDKKSKTKVPVIICIICAIICIIATLLILFIVPSKYNLVSKKNTTTTVTNVIESSPAPVSDADTKKSDKTENTEPVKVVVEKTNAEKSESKTTAKIEEEKTPAPVVETVNNTTESVKEETEQKPEEESVPEAKEDEIVIIENAEDVVPSQPEVVVEKPKNTTYKIKWGDTLWDISNTYYKNPWRYKYIARYNGIKDPDYIISGTTIIIPAE